ncbi:MULTISPECIES: hypothetical protein [unclassified Methanoregula]|uniref:hypothetical protein n=1 Tax=unclassified Methanoregula TaxID=2649730 RepID=UPI0009D05BB8|nr:MULTISPECIES: hypothetical protein [unclassified Methanoregula]OPX63901.1 MAG: hypothetical protein A4E33_01430 [Methanoregula sp. PtaB.Bin085]OPY35454.1 MAG: hypothetical protein A4E34_00728 [Methanoregula sp. PtaU1.Bin006]
MKKIVLLVIGLLFLPAITLAYQVNIDAPETLTVGKPLVVSGVTTFPPGMSVDVVLYYQLTTTTEIKRQVVSIKPDKTFKVVFDTTGLTTGTYKVEVPVNGMGDSVTMRLVRIVDRSDEIRMDSDTTQEFNGTLVIAGTIEGDENSGVQVEIVGPDGSVVFGPQFVNTDSEGSFSTNVPIRVPGKYEVSFTDAKGFIGTRVLIAEGPQTPVPTLSEAAASRKVVSAHTVSSQNTPAFFSVKTIPGPVMLYTSSSADWVIEYSDDNGVLHRENNQDARNPEKAAFTGTGSTVFVSVYPNDPAVQGEVYLYAENAESVSVSPTKPAPFATASSRASGGLPALSLTPLAGLAALAAALFLRR